MKKPINDYLCFILLAFILLPTNVYSQWKKDYKVLNDTLYTIMKDKKFDIERLEKNKNNLGDYRFTKEDGTIIIEDVIGSGYRQVIKPAKKFYTITRLFYLDGSLDRRYIELSGLLIDTFYEFDEAGNQTRAEDMEVDLPKKFDYNQLMLLMHRKKWINIKTGEGREDFTLEYYKDTNRWVILFHPQKKNIYLGTEYQIDANSGKIKKKTKVREL